MLLLRGPKVRIFAASNQETIMQDTKDLWLDWYLGSEEVDGDE
jgi:hypothetical protein